MESHGRGIALLILLLLALLLFWKKLFSQTESVSATVGGIPVNPETGTAMAAATSPISPSNAPALVPYTPQPGPLTEADLQYGLTATPYALDLHPASSSGLTQADHTQINTAISPPMGLMTRYTA